MSFELQMHSAGLVQITPLNMTNGMGSVILTHSSFRVVCRAGWLENEPARVTGRMEVRPAAELGPIILCLDTSASMKVRGLGL